MSRISRILAAFTGLLLLSTMVPASAQDSLEDARGRRESVQAEAALTASEIDILEAEDADIVAALEQLDVWIATQESRLDRAEQDLQATQEAGDQARERADMLDISITDLRAQVTEQSINSYIQGFSSNDGVLLGADNINSVPVIRFVLDESSGISADTTDLLRVALDQQVDAIAEAEAAGRAALQLRGDIETQIADLETTRTAQEKIRTEIDRRIIELEDTAAVLDAESAQIEEFIRDEVARLAAEAEEKRRLEEQARLAEEQRIAEAAAADEQRIAEEAAAEDQRIADEEAAAAEQDRLAEEAAAEPTPEPEAEESDPGTPVQEPAPEPTAVPDPEPRSDSSATPTFRRPVPGAVSSGYGYRVHPVYGTERLHNGIDYNAGRGTPIGASAPGTVIFAGTFSGYGTTVIVQHTGGFTTLYAHMSGLNVANGASVSAGDTVGFVGSTGLSTGPHLHFEIRLNGTAVDPARYM